MRRRGTLGPTIEDMPIPRDAQPDCYWTGNMLDMEAVVGAYATLLIVDAYGGDEIEIPRHLQHAGDLIDLVGTQTAKAFIDVYGGSALYIPLAREAIKWAKAEPVLRQVRAAEISITEASRRLRMKRASLSEYLARNGKRHSRRCTPKNPTLL
ncbi:hypothetical protein B5C34_05325 [Pacificimonas flava]|uniref:Mor transcription activator domain-containing protein n=2 Tax=Pacificimonas TaxID=1960290 RepID=A0A219B469_9SPHN|nr:MULTISPECIES: hypothetical protein [Pacificimonas]MBZ6377359.1 hypothetical protein [Pacificimonas aurantium]OWV32933.1 hypothetical protein B5C34_05325 [Pacificimonas flava]